LCACKKSPASIEGDKLLAKVGSKTLYLSEIESMIPERSTEADSLRIMTAFAENWARETVVLLHAEKSLPEDINLDKLVKNYRESLLINNIEKDFIEKNLDTMVTVDQVESYYKDNKDLFLITDPLVKCWIAKVPEKAKGIERFYKSWKGKKKKDVEDYCRQYADLGVIEEETWNYLSELKLFFPSKLLDKIRFEKGKIFQDNYKSSEYFVYIFDVIKSGEESPLNMVKNKIVKLILHQRKQQLVMEFKESLYERELKNNKVKFYVNE
jgi:hypothetical protein